MSAAITRHGTASRYNDGCRCEPCTKAISAMGRNRQSGAFAGRSELSEWMRGIGWDRAIPRQIPDVFVTRWNREHPERPYIGSAS